MLSLDPLHHRGANVALPRHLAHALAGRQRRPDRLFDLAVDARAAEMLALASDVDADARGEGRAFGTGRRFRARLVRIEAAPGGTQLVLQLVAKLIGVSGQDDADGPRAISRRSSSRP